MVDPNADQIAFWDGAAGDTWGTQQAVMDALLTPVLDGVIARAALGKGQNILDVGCGTGQSTIAAAGIVGADGHVLGADVSEPMLAVARARAGAAKQTQFVRADVARHTFEPGMFDCAISRFGVMFFADTTAAFANIARSVKSGGRVSFATWGQIDQNPWFTLPARVAREMFGPTPKSDPDAPGPFALRDVPKVAHMLRSAGFGQVQCDVQTVGLTLPEGPRAIAQLCLHIGPAANALKHFAVDKDGAQALEDALTTAFAALPDHVVPAQINFFTALRS